MTHIYKIGPEMWGQIPKKLAVQNIKILDFVTWSWVSPEPNKMLSTIVKCHCRLWWLVQTC